MSLGCMVFQLLKYGTVSVHAETLVLLSMSVYAVRIVYFHMRRKFANRIGIL
jgi:hypothetical protein